jgi:hypothetical protein
MLKNIFIISIGVYCLILNNTILSGYELIESLDSKCMTISHTEGQGLGYKQGYSSLDLFLAQPIFHSQIIPFADLRGHVFNNGRYAGNAGLGVRWLNSCYNKVWGINCYYDSFCTFHLPYHQVGFGLEALGEKWDARINGYLPVGRKKTQIYRLSYDFTSSFLAKVREQFALGGFDAELGYHFCNSCFCDLYAGLGPYFYWGRSKETKNAFRKKFREAYGGRLSLAASFWGYFKLEGYTAYDSFFRWTGQATLSLNIPLDFWNPACACIPSLIEDQLFQQVRRNEIIVVERANRFSSNPAILDPEFEP